ncbi:hypothetical protein K8I85_11070, partial [bacterium]|nr:hypothetical protein [bacterium]
RRIALRSAIEEADARFFGPAEGAVDDIESILYGALRARADTGDAGTFLHDTARGLAFLDRRDVGYYALGIPALDRMSVGLVQGELLLYLAGKNTGKSWFCIHCGRQAIIQGARVAHITLEMDEDRVTQRYYQTFLAIASRDAEYVRARLLTEKGDPKGIKRDDQEYAVGFKDRVASPRAAFSDPKIRRWIRDKIEPWRGRMSRLVVKRFPTGQLTVDALRSYLDLLEQAHKFVPNVLIVDYPDLMKLSSRDFRVDLGRLYIALRGLGVERSMAVVAPTQTNRAGLSAKTTDATMVSEDKTKLDTADTVLMYSQTRQERKRGLARLALEYSRDSERGHVIVLAQSYATGQYVLQSALQSGAYWDAVRSGDEEDEG